MEMFDRFKAKAEEIKSNVYKRRLKKWEREKLYELEKARKEQERIEEEREEIEAERTRLIGLDNKELLVEVIFAIRGFYAQVVDLRNRLEDVEDSIASIEDEIEDIQGELRRMGNQEADTDD